MDMQQYYPTPQKVAERLARMIDIDSLEGLNVLEPSAGTGELVEAMRQAYHYGSRQWDYNPRFNFHCVEINRERRAILKDKELRVVWDDFLTFNPIMQYPVIIMNPPFDDGAKHLMKAMQVCAPGGQIVCILNAETIKNPYTNERKWLLDMIEKQEDHRIEFEQYAFSDADRKTDVEIALVYVRMKAEEERCITLDNLKKQVFEARQKEEENGAVIRHGEIYGLIDMYQAETRTALTLYKEIVNYEKLSRYTKDGYDSADVFEIKINEINSDFRNTREIEIVRRINYKYWRLLLYSKELSSLMTSAIQQEYSNRLIEMSDYEFNERNIIALKEDLSRGLIGGIEEAIMSVWRKFTCEFAYTDYSQNIHYYNGWKTNKAYKCNKKVIIPMYAFDSWDHKFTSHRISGEMSDIEKAMNYLDCGRTDHFDICSILSMAQQTQNTKNIDTKFFKVTLYKKGTCHLTFKDDELLKKFNLYCGRKNNWLPDDYGRKPYSSLSEEEADIVNSFEGRQSYEDTFARQEFYLTSPGELVMLGAGGVA